MDSRTRAVDPGMQDASGGVGKDSQLRGGSSTTSDPDARSIHSSPLAGSKSSPVAGSGHAPPHSSDAVKRHAMSTGDKGQMMNYGDTMNAPAQPSPAGKKYGMPPSGDKNQMMTFGATIDAIIINDYSQTKPASTSDTSCPGDRGEPSGEKSSLISQIQDSTDTGKIDHLE